MSKKTYLYRYLVIIKRLTKAPASFDEIAFILQNESEIRDEDYTISKRSFQRDIKEIESLFNIEIVFSKSIGKYIIHAESEANPQHLRLLEAFETINAMQLASDHLNHIYFEARKPAGLHHFSGLMHAISNRFQIAISYKKFYESDSTQRILHPLALKESQGRWYLIAVQVNDDTIKTFGLDRIEDMDISKRIFKAYKHIDIGAMFRNCFGVLSSEEAPQQIILAFSAFQAQYVASYPFHHSQKIYEGKDYVKTHEDEVLIELNLCITHDFVMQLLSYGDDVKVIAPDPLIKNIQKRLTKALKQYLFS